MFLCLSHQNEEKDKEIKKKKKKKKWLQGAQKLKAIIPTQLTFFPGCLAEIYQRF